MTSASDPATAVDLSRLQAPNVVEALSFETILAGMLADLVARDPTFTALVESDPAMKILEVCAFREMLLRQRVNDAARSVMVAFALGEDLDHLAAGFRVFRLVLDEGDEETPPTYESDDDLRRRVVLAPEGYSVAGPEGAYVFHALSADADVLDASVISPDPGEVVVTVLSRIGDGTAAGPLLTTVTAALNDEDVRPLTDQVTVQSATIIDFTIEAEVFTFIGPDAGVVLEQGLARLDEYLANSKKLGRDVTRSGIIAALTVEGVQDVVITSPAANVACDRTEAANCTAIDVTHGGVGE